MYIFLFNFFKWLSENKYFLYLLQYCITQNIITIAILPIYSSWGIPFSPLSILGNFIFSPFLFLYIVLSCIIFVGFFFQHAFTWVINILQKITKIWIYLMENLSSLFDVGFIGFIDIPELSYLFCWGSIVILLYYRKIFFNKITFFLVSSTVLLLLIGIMSSFKKTKNKFFIQEGQNTYLVHYNSENSVIIILMDRKRKTINKNHLKYLLLPEIIKNFKIINPKIMLY